MEKLNNQEKKKLLEVASLAIKDFVLRGEKNDFVAEGVLGEKRAVFVTIYKHGSLRGCIGQIIAPSKTLIENVRDMAIAAATEDFRFDPVRAEELDELEIEISILSPTEKIDSWEELELGKHGVIVSQGRNSGVFLPQVAHDTGWNLQEFLEHLCEEKAGLNKNSYKDPDTVIEVFSVESFKSCIT